MLIDVMSKRVGITKTTLHTDRLSIYNMGTYKKHAILTFYDSIHSAKPDEEFVCDQDGRATRPVRRKGCFGMWCVRFDRYIGGMNPGNQYFYAGANKVTKIQNEPQRQ